MAKEVVKRIKLQIEAGKATPAPPVGTVLGPAGVNLGEFCTKFNEATRDKMGDVVPCEISVYDDRSFDFVLKTSPAAFLIKNAAGGVLHPGVPSACTGGERLSRRYYQCDAAGCALRQGIRFDA